MRNIGNAPTGDTVGVAFLVDGQYITFGTSGALAPGVSQLIKSVSSWPATAGDHTLTAVVDDINRYPEISETNNTLDLSFHVEARPAPALSDVVVRDIAFEQEEGDQGAISGPGGKHWPHPNGRSGRGGLLCRRPVRDLWPHLAPASWRKAGHSS